MIETQKAYIAGLFDGEGSVSFRFHHAGRKLPDGTYRRYGYLLARISQKDRFVLDMVREMVGYGSVNSAGQGKFAYHVSRRLARKFLDDIASYTIVKLPEICIALTEDEIHVKPHKK